MAIFTPTGLKIRLSVEYAFGLMARLFPKITPFKFLKTIEGIALLPSVFAFISAIICLISNYDPLIIGAYTFCSYCVGLILNTSGIFSMAFINLGIFYSYLSGYGIFIIIICIVGYIYSSILGIIAVFAAKFVGYLLSSLIDSIYTKIKHKHTGQVFTGAERDFFNTYKYFAFKLGIISSIDLSDNEIQEEYWGETYNHLAQNWPQVVSRFTV